MKLAGCALGVLAALLLTPAHAEETEGGEEGTIESVYTELGEGACKQISFSEEGGSYLGSCTGYAGYGVLLAEGDLRTSVFYGFVGEWYAEGAWESFGAFNSVNDTVEWRLKDGVPYATILRWFLDNPNPDTGAPDEAHRGEVLVVSKVAQPGIGDGCVVGYVDAKENADANELARQVADELAADFMCRTDEPVFHGEEGLLAGFPQRTFGP